MLSLVLFQSLKTLIPRNNSSLLDTPLEPDLIQLIDPHPTELRTFLLTKLPVLLSLFCYPFAQLAVSASGRSVCMASLVTKVYQLLIPRKPSSVISFLTIVIPDEIKCIQCCNSFFGHVFYVELLVQYPNTQPSFFFDIHVCMTMYSFVFSQLFKTSIPLGWFPLKADLLKLCKTRLGLWIISSFGVQLTLPGHPISKSRM
mmetsp:Transcript_10497/g.23117  ORF Transcript_10497/g.23117 Transcript_10497/m.23117 type:complete len:201 (-) Transcript_10497:354-956(-)